MKFTLCLSSLFDTPRRSAWNLPVFASVTLRHFDLSNFFLVQSQAFLCFYSLFACQILCYFLCNYEQRNTKPEVIYLWGKLIGLSAKIIILSGSLTSISHRSQKYFPEFNLSQAFLEMKETIDNKMGVVWTCMFQIYTLQ